MDSANSQSQNGESLVHSEFDDWVELCANMQKAGGIWMEITQLLQSAPKTEIPLDPLNISESMANTWLNFWRDPQTALQKQVKLLSGMQDIWGSYFAGSNNMPAAAQKPHKRFSHAGWQENLIFAFLRSTYLYVHSWMDEVISDVKDMSEHDKIVAGLTTRNMIEALNPANFAMSNPEVLEVTMKEKGENLVRGLTMMREDIIRGKGQLLIRQVDTSAFEVGKNIAVTKGDVIYENGHFQIIQYASKTKKVNSTPILIVPPWINKFYILDLNEKKSFAKWLVEEGNTVFMISWINADASTKDFTWESRMQAVREAIDVVCRECETEKTHLISFCIGGTMVGSLLASLGKTGDDSVASSTFLTAQFDFEHAGELMAFVSEKSVDMLSSFEEQGFIPAESMSNAFNLLRSSDLIWSYIVNNYVLGREPMAFDLLYWNSDAMCMPTKVQKYYLDEFYLKNAFMKNCLDIGGEKVGVQDITVPTYHLAAIEDHIAPAASVYIAAKAMKNADVRFVLSGSGHIAGVVNPPIMEKYLYWRNDDLASAGLDAWRLGAESFKGSWWLDWKDWHAKLEQKEVDARITGCHFATIEPAPGRFVRVKSEN